MKLVSFLLITLICGAAGGCEQPAPAPAEKSPFHSVIVRGGSIVATLPAAPAWLVGVGTADSRRSTPQEAFTLAPGDVMRLSGRHISHEVTAQIVPEAGVTIESTFDARSFGDGVSKRKFFIPAK